MFAPENWKQKESIILSDTSGGVYRLSIEDRENFSVQSVTLAVLGHFDRISWTILCPPKFFARVALVSLWLSAQDGSEMWRVPGLDEGTFTLGGLES